ncbi:LigA [Nocardioidaceae bacterium Broad-1]|nr:LigA [Nocardioidaceae bacterium Broad-1]
MQKTLIVHSGTFKTGSTAIQSFLARANKEGSLPPEVVYPTIGRGEHSIQHQNLYSQLVGEVLFMPALGTWEQLVKSIASSSAETTVISCESFSLLTPEHISAIGEYARQAGAQVRWVHYVRDQATFYNAFYVERLMVMRPEHAELVDLPFEEFREWSPLDMSFLHYGQFAETITTAIPDVDLRLRPFIRKELRDGNAVADFFSTCELPIKATGAASSNVGSGWRTVETARHLAPIVAAAPMRGRLRGADSWKATRLRWIQMIRGDFVTLTTQLGWNNTSAVYMTPEFRQELLDDYREDNLLIGKLGGFDFTEMIERSTFPDYNIGDYSEIPGDEVLQVVKLVMQGLHTIPEEIQEEVEAARARRREAEAARQRGRLRRLLRR